MKNRKLVAALGALAAFGAVAGCAPAEQQKTEMTDLQKTQAQAYATANGCKLAYENDFSGSEIAAYSGCNTDPEKRGTTKAQDAAEAAARAVREKAEAAERAAQEKEAAEQAQKQKAYEEAHEAWEKAHSAWEEEAVDNEIVTVDTEEETTMERVTDRNRDLMYTRLVDFKTGQLCMIFAESEKNNICADFDRLSSTQSTYVGSMRQHMAQRKAYFAREPQEPKEPEVKVASEPTP